MTATTHPVGSPHAGRSERPAPEPTRDAQPDGFAAVLLAVAPTVPSPTAAVAAASAPGRAAAGTIGAVAATPGTQAGGGHAADQSTVPTHDAATDQRSTDAAGGATTDATQPTGGQVAPAQPPTPGQATATSGAAAGVTAGATSTPAGTTAAPAATSAPTAADAPTTSTPAPAAPSNGSSSPAGQPQPALVAAVHAAGRLATHPVGDTGPAHPGGPAVGLAAGVVVGNGLTVVGATAAPVGLQASAEAGTSPPAGTAPGADGLDGQLAAVVVPAARGGDGASTITLALHPAELGAVTVEVRVHAGVVDLRFAAPEGAARDAITAALPQLRDSLDAAGLRAGRAEVTRQPTPPFAAHTSTGEPGTSGQQGHAGAHTWAGTARRPFEGAPSPTDAPRTERRPAATAAAPASSAALDLEL